MNSMSRAALNRLLAQEAERLQKAIGTQQELTRPDENQVGDEGDHALTQADRGQHQTVVEHLKQLLSQVEAARERMAAGTYGVCMGCGRPIPPERLEAVPYATLCVDCQSKHEKGKMRRTGFALVAER